MALSTISTLSALKDLLCRPQQAVAPVDAHVPIAACMDAYLPVYSFSARQDEPITKLARVDSMPTVPDLVSEPRCGLLSPFGTQSAFADMETSFNNLPLRLHSSPPNFSAMPVAFPSVAKASWLAHTLPPCELPFSNHCTSVSMPATAVVPELTAGGRAQPPRRNASDVLLVRPRGNVALGSSSSGELPAAGAAEVPNRSLLEAMLMSMWEDRADRGLFRYDVSECIDRVLPGPRGFIAQLNEGRATKKRPTEFTMDRVLQPYNPKKFNFQKAAVSETLVAFQPCYSSRTRTSSPCILPPTAPLSDIITATSDTTLAEPLSVSSPHLILINVSPIDHCHVLLVPRVLHCLPQALNTSTVLLAMLFARELGNPHFRVGYNSLGAFATINHLHFHSYYLPLDLPCELAATKPLSFGPEISAVSACGCGDGNVAYYPTSLPSKKRTLCEDCAVGGGFIGGPNSSGVIVSRLVDYPVNGFVVETVSSGGLEAVAHVVGTAASRMQAANQPFNLLVSEAGRRVFVFPQCYAERQAAGVVPEEILDTGVNPAAFEIAGHLVLKRREDYVGANEDWALRLLAAVSLEEERFLRVARMCFGNALE